MISMVLTWWHQPVKVHKGWVVVAKSPVLHPGDVRMFQAIDCPALHHIVDCLVFPQKGHRPHPNELAGEGTLLSVIIINAVACRTEIYSHLSSDDQDLIWMVISTLSAGTLLSFFPAWKIIQPWTTLDPNLKRSLQ